MYAGLVIKVNGTCSLNTEPNDFAYSVTARYVRIIPIQWVGASVCLRMEFYGCTISGKIKKFIDPHLNALLPL